MTGPGDLEPICFALLDKFIEALNAYDAEWMDACMHFPHVRMAEGRVAVYDRPGSNPMALFDRLKAEDGWHHSAWDEREILQAGPDKVHVAVSYTRYREDDSAIGRYNSLYILTRQNGRWGIQARSSFGP